MIRRNKYNAKKTTVDGIVFASKAEAKRYGELKLLERAGLIRGLRLHPRFVLQEKNGADRAIVYVADFSYLENAGGKTVVEDVKGAQTTVFRMKAKLFRAKYPHIELRII